MIQLPGPNPSVREVPVVAYNTAMKTIYIGSQGGNPLVGSYSGQNLNGYALDEARNHSFISFGNKIVEFNASDNSLVGSISVGDVLARLAYDPTNHYPYVANRSPNGSVIAISVG